MWGPSFLLANLLLTFVSAQQVVPDFLDYVAAPTVRMVYVLTRHGTRSPLYTYKKDPYPRNNPLYWPDGIGELTRNGKQQLFTTGQILRVRYGALVKIPFVKEETLILSNNFDRDIESAAVLAAGLYPPTAHQLWNPLLPWNPVPIHIDPFDVVMLMENQNDCPKFKIELINSLNELNFQSSKFEKFFNYLANHTGEKIQKISDLTKIYDAIAMQIENGFRMPDWIRPIWPEPMKSLHHHSLAALASGTPQVVRILGGPILANISKTFQDKASGTLKPSRKLVIDAVHDVTVQAAFGGLGYPGPNSIETSAFLIFELHDSTQGYFVEVHYYNSSNQVLPNPIEIPQCPAPCSLTEFSSIVKEITPEDWNMECQLPLNTGQTI